MLSLKKYLQALFRAEHLSFQRINSQIQRIQRECHGEDQGTLGVEREGGVSED